MPYSAQNLVISAAEYKVILTFNNGLTVPLLTLEEISTSHTRENEDIHVIGQEEPVANKRNGAKFSGSMTVQVGEFASILKAAGLVESTQIENATLGITSLNAFGIQRVYNSININDESISIKSKDKDSKIALKWNALSVSGITA